MRDYTVEEKERLVNALNESMQEINCETFEDINELLLKIFYALGCAKACSYAKVEGLELSASDLTLVETIISLCSCSSSLLDIITHS